MDGGFTFVYFHFFSSEKLNLQSVEDYKYLRQSNCYSITDVDDAEEFRTVTVYSILHCLFLNDDLQQYTFILYDYNYFGFV